VPCFIGPHGRGRSPVISDLAARHAGNDEVGVGRIDVDRGRVWQVTGAPENHVDLGPRRVGDGTVWIARSYRLIVGPDQTFINDYCFRPLFPLLRMRSYEEIRIVVDGNDRALAVGAYVHSGPSNPARLRAERRETNRGGREWSDLMKVTPGWALSLLLAVFAANTALSQTSVITYHNDRQRTGWNSAEIILTPATVASRFGHIVTVPLDDQVDTQPLVVPNQTIEGMGVHSVVYVTTEGNTVYAIDAADGAILKQRNLGVPVPMPLNCFNNGPNVGINGTATIDPIAGTLYVLVYIQDGKTPRYDLHALDLANLADRPGSPIVVQATRNGNGTKYTFQAGLQRQRAALLDAQGRIFAGFGSFCDLSAPLDTTTTPPHTTPPKSGPHSRGWLLSWDKTSLALDSPHELTNRLPTSNTSICVWSGNEPCFLSSIWMSGYGLAVDSSGDIYFTTGNTASGTYDSVSNIAESAVRMSGGLTQVVDFFTPSDHDMLDEGDNDYGSGGLLVLPDQPATFPFPHLAVGAGKDGRMFVLNRDAMGKLSTPDTPQNVYIGNCWCGPSYFRSSAGPRVVSSGGAPVPKTTPTQWQNRVMTWAPTVSLGKPSLALVASSPLLETNVQDPGFFTSVSSNGTAPNTAIIWAVGRAACDQPTCTSFHVTLYAFNATPSAGVLPQLWAGVAGSWPNTGGNANIIPTVANGRVYVASNKELQIFGLH
jgi:hypothetical protein